MLRADRSGGREGSTGCEVTNHDIQPVTHQLYSCSEHRVGLIAWKTTHQTYACAIRSFDTAHPGNRFNSNYFSCNCCYLAAVQPAIDISGFLVYCKYR